MKMLSNGDRITTVLYDDVERKIITFPGGRFGDYIESRTLFYILCFVSTVYGDKGFPLPMIDGIELTNTKVTSGEVCDLLSFSR